MEIDLSNIEAEYIALSQVVYEVICFMALMKEVYFIFDIHFPNSKLIYKVFENNQSFFLSQSSTNSH